MERSVYHSDRQSGKTIEVYVTSERLDNTFDWGGWRTQYGVYIEGRRVATIRKDVHQPRPLEWVIFRTGERTASAYEGALGSALTRVGRLYFADQRKAASKAAAKAERTTNPFFTPSHVDMIDPKSLVVATVEANLSPVVCKHCGCYVPLGWTISDEFARCPKTDNTRPHATSPEAFLSIVDTVVNRYPRPTTQETH